MHRLPACLLVLGLGLSGCLAADEGSDPGMGGDTDAPGSVQVGDRPDPSFGDVSTGPAAGPDTQATLAAPPRLVPGEWWRVKFTSPLDGREAEYVRVVAAVEGDTYVVGMPHEGWYKEAVVYHAPGFGDVNSDLSYNTHNVRFQPVEFPLTDETTWETEFSGGSRMKASVKTEGDKLATVTFTDVENGNPMLELVYDATIHEVREFRQPTVHYEVVEHGYDFQGWVTVPRGEDLVFFHGRIGPALDIDLTPSPPVESVEVAGGFNRLTFIQAVQAVAGSPGVYRERAVAPDGTEYVTATTGGSEFTVNFFEHANPDGAWELEHVAGGAGVAFIEGIAYHQYDIRLPDGLRRSDHSHPVVR